MSETWRLRLRTLEAMSGLTCARLLIAWVPLERWRHRLGVTGQTGVDQLADARRLAAHVARASGRVPFRAKCLPQALALSWMLRKRDIAHDLVIAARPAGTRHGDDDLHAWVEAGETVVLGELPGPWVEVLRAP